MKSEHHLKRSKREMNDDISREKWDDVYSRSGDALFEIDNNLLDVLSFFNKRGVRRILDLGCGAGRHVIYLAKKGFEIYGIDISPEGIKSTKRKSKNEKVSVNLKIGSIYDELPYGDDFFDAVISIRVLNHARIEDIHTAIVEIERVLALKGLVFVTVRKRVSKERRLSHKNVAPRTYIPLEGKEKGIVHYLFTKKIIRKEFKNFKALKFWIDKENDYYCFLGELKLKVV